MNRHVVRVNESLLVALGLVMASRRGDTEGLHELFASLDDDQMVEVFGAMTALARDSRRSDDELRALAYELAAES